MKKRTWRYYKDIAKETTKAKKKYLIKCYVASGVVYGFLVLAIVIRYN